jgi:eukaryotic-like serine/threonine-protein kinase
MATEGQILAERYVLEAPIASGGMATVWRARDDVLARPIAVKLLHPHLAEDESFVERFRVEALAAARLAHPNIVSIYDTGSESSDQQIDHYIVMEHCGGGTLGDLVAEGPMDPDRVASVGATICDALAYAHSRSIVHRDIKPHNVLVSDHNSLKVTDFGIAKAAFQKTDITTTGKIIGTVTYISPEQANGDEPDARSDLYSLGVLLYELTIGRPPFEADTDVAIALKHLNEMPPSLRSLRAGIPRSLDSVIMRSLAKDPNERYGSADEMRSALVQGASGGSTQVIRTPARREPSTSSRSASPAPSASDRRKTGEGFMSGEGRRMLPIIGLVVAAIVAAILIAGALGQDGSEDEPRTKDDNNGASVKTLDVSQADDFDPAGDGVEHPESVGEAIDGDPATAWTTEGYNSAISAQKPGVGLLLDLGTSVTVAEVEITFGSGDYDFELRASDELGSDHEAFEVISSVRGSSEKETVAAGASARYWLVWITDLPGGGAGTGTIAEVRFLGE